MSYFLSPEIMTKADPQTSYSFMQQVFVSKSHQACHIACRMQLCSVLGFLRHRQCFWKQSFMPVSFIWPAVVSWISCHGWVLWNCSCCAYLKKKWNTVQRQKRPYFEKCLDWRHHFSVWLPARLHLLLEAWCDSGILDRVKRSVASGTLVKCGTWHLVESKPSLVFEQLWPCRSWNTHTWNLNVLRSDCFPTGINYKLSSQIKPAAAPPTPQHQQDSFSIAVEFPQCFHLFHC